MRFRLYATEKDGARETQPVFSAPEIQMEGQEGSARNLRLSLSVQLPADFQMSTVALLLEPAQKTPEVKAALLANGKPAAVTVNKGGQGLWYWFTTELGRGSHALEFNLQLPSEMRGGAKVSGWLRAKRPLVAEDLRLRFKPGQRLSPAPEDVLPASSQIERKTYAIFDEFIE